VVKYLASPPSRSPEQAKRNFLSSPRWRKAAEVKDSKQATQNAQILTDRPGETNTTTVRDPNFVHLPNSTFHQAHLPHYLSFSSWSCSDTAQNEAFTSSGCPSALRTVVNVRPFSVSSDVPEATLPHSLVPHFSATPRSGAAVPPQILLSVICRAAAPLAAPPSRVGNIVASLSRGGSEGPVLGSVAALVTGRGGCGCTIEGIP